MLRPTTISTRNLALLRNGFTIAIIPAVLRHEYILSRPTIARTIKTLQSRELIRRIGSDKTGHWEVVRKEKGT